MNHSNQLREFEKEFKNLFKKYRSLENDFKKFERYIFENPNGEGKNFVIIYRDEKIKIIKTRLACESLRGRSMRVIYSYSKDTLTFMYIEIYFKGDKENEDRGRIKEYLKSLSRN